jgi:hypothetical protein
MPKSHNVCGCVHDWWLHWMYLEQRFGKNEDVNTIKVLFDFAYAAPHTEKDTYMY